MRWHNNEWLAMWLELAIWILNCLYFIRCVLETEKKRPEFVA